MNRRKMKIIKKINIWGLVIGLAIGLCGCSGGKMPSLEVNFDNESIDEQVVMESMEKEKLVTCYETLKEQTVYTIGTIHGSHFDSSCKYSMQDLESIITHLKPDCVMIECREETFDQYGVLDGPIDMIYVYSYCKEQGIDVKMIDYWKIDNEFMSQHTDDFRDNQIFYNINHKLEEIKAHQKVLIFYGDAHYYYQKPRIEKAGWKKVEVGDVATLFEHSAEAFTYPKGMAQVIQDKIDFFNEEMPKIVEKNVTDEKVKQSIEETMISLVESLAFQKSLVERNQLFAN